MIELLLAADRLLVAGDLDRAERIYQQVVEADPRNAIAVVGLAQVARARGLSANAADLLWRALEIDPEDQAAQRLAMTWAKGQTTSDEPAGELALVDVPANAPAPAPPAPPAPPPPAALTTPPPAPAVAPRPSMLARIRAWLGLPR
jgi:tetratricopeptide (TPR) repeat protein